MGNCESGQNIYCCKNDEQNLKDEQILNQQNQGRLSRGIVQSKFQSIGSIQSQRSMNVYTNESEHFIIRKDFRINESRYTGQMVLGEQGTLVPHGFGTQIWSDNTIYQGNFDMGKKQGNGKLTWPDKKFYVGQFQDDQIEGLGTLLSPNKKILYNGGWKQNRFEGQGREVFNDGDSYYMGHYEEGQKHGAGTLRKSDGSYHKGNWQYDQLKGKVVGRLRCKKDSASTDYSKFSIDLSEKQPKMRVPRKRQTNSSVNMDRSAFQNHNQTFDSIRKTQQNTPKKGFSSAYDVSRAKSPKLPPQTKGLEQNISPYKEGNYNEKEPYSKVRKYEDNI